MKLKITTESETGNVSYSVIIDDKSHQTLTLGDFKTLLEKLNTIYLQLAATAPDLSHNNVATDNTILKSL